MENLKRAAEENLRQLNNNPYPGRGIVLGQTAEGVPIQLYWIMGRSENSRNRVFEEDGGDLFTRAADPKKMKDPSLVIYRAMTYAGGFHLVTNGDQTDTLENMMGEGKTWMDALRTREFEPDKPNFTPRISGGMDTDGSSGWLSILKAGPFYQTAQNQTYRYFFEYPRLEPGFGWCITTYRGDGTPLPSFLGEPLLIPINGEGEEILDWCWHKLNERNLVSLALKIIQPDGNGTAEIYIKNKN